MARVSYVALPWRWRKAIAFRDYVMCVFCFFTVFCDKILDPNYEKANFYFVSCSEEEDQGVLESEEEEEMDSDSSVAVGGYFFFTLPKSSPLISNFEYIEISIYNTQYMKYIFMFVNDYLSLENLSTIDFMLMIQIFIRIIIMFVQLLVAQIFLWDLPREWQGVCGGPTISFTTLPDLLQC